MGYTFRHANAFIPGLGNALQEAAKNKEDFTRLMQVRQIEVAERNADINEMQAVASIEQNKINSRLAEARNRLAEKQFAFEQETAKYERSQTARQERNELARLGGLSERPRSWEMDDYATVTLADGSTMWVPTDIEQRSRELDLTTEQQTAMLNLRTQAQIKIYEQTTGKRYGEEVGLSMARMGGAELQPGQAVPDGLVAVSMGGKTYAIKPDAMRAVENYKAQKQVELEMTEKIENAKIRVQRNAGAMSDREKLEVSTAIRRLDSLRRSYEATAKVAQGYHEEGMKTREALAEAEAEKQGLLNKKGWGGGNWTGADATRVKELDVYIVKLQGSIETLNTQAADTTTRVTEIYGKYNTALKELEALESGERPPVPGAEPEDAKDPFEEAAEGPFKQ